MVRFVEDGPESDLSSHGDVAPVIPLFGGGVGGVGGGRSGRHRPDGHPSGVDEPRGAGGGGSVRTGASKPEHRPGRERVGRRALAGGSDSLEDGEARAEFGTGARAEFGTGADAGVEAEAELAERLLLRKLRTRSLSVTEARAVVADFDLDEGQVLTLLDDFLRRGYLDDAALAEQLVHSATTRKGQGRRAVAQTLAKRGIPRDVAEAAIAEMPDDEAERALEFARSKARSMGSLEFDTALRRLSGQLARRGYGGSVAMTAAREALAEVGVGRSSVRFR